MKKLTALGMIAITIAANITPMQAEAAGVRSYYQCPGGSNATIISGNSLSDIQSKLQELGINPDSVKLSNAVNSQNCPTNAGQVKAANTDANCVLSQDCVKNGCVGNQCATNQCQTSQCTTSQCPANLCPSKQCPTAKTPEKSVNTTTETKQAQAAPVSQVNTKQVTDTKPENTTKPAATNTTTKNSTTNTTTKNSTTNTTTKNSTTNSTNSNAVNTTTKDTTKNASYAEQVVKLVNIERAKEGLAPLTIDSNVEKAAMVRANEIQTKFAHVRPNGTGFVTALKEAGAVYRGAGENIAWGQKTPEEVVAGWMNSPGHRANIMNKNYVHIGVGNLQNSSGTQYWVQIFTY